jgi:peptide/nickel transport system permease protein
MTAQPRSVPIDWGEVAPRRRFNLLEIRGLPILAITSFIFVVFVIVGTFAYDIAPHDPHQQALIERLKPPVYEIESIVPPRIAHNGEWKHPLGTDNLGRDELSRLIAGTRVSLLVAVTAIPASLIIGTTLGLLAGWRRGLIDRFLMRLVDIQLALPAVLFAILLAAVRGPQLSNVVIVLVVWGWAIFARLVRSEVLSLRERDFVTAARSIGGGDLWIITRHLLPNVVNIIVILATLDIATVILAEAALSFLGVGVPITTPSWGSMVSGGRNFLTIAWWLVTVPGLAILIISLAGNLLGDWLRDALEPRLKNVR